MEETWQALLAVARQEIEGDEATGSRKVMPIRLNNRRADSADVAVPADHYRTGRACYPAGGGRRAIREAVWPGAG